MEHADPSIVYNRALDIILKAGIAKLLTHPTASNLRSSARPFGPALRCVPQHSCFSEDPQHRAHLRFHRPATGIVTLPLRQPVDLPLRKSSARHCARRRPSAPRTLRPAAPGIVRRGAARTRRAAPVRCAPLGLPMPSALGLRVRSAPGRHRAPFWAADVLRVRSSGGLRSRLPMPFAGLSAILGALRSGTFAAYDAANVGYRLSLDNIWQRLFAGNSCLRAQVMWIRRPDRGPRPPAHRPARPEPIRNPRPTPSVAGGPEGPRAGQAKGCVLAVCLHMFFLSGRRRHTVPARRRLCPRGGRAAHIGPGAITPEQELPSAQRHNTQFA